ncbi:Membrane protein, putative [Acidisarcina polymorpha]|uniref:Membrane protein, putative n=1 Tax=Acidisarcina polymorpha TaxID=2211140 RepID=A0A2Z5G2I4_9BACT|nr:heparan-alpha-glucosaminide N-acetyltransferase domain-containing protein [Acidisarcina polymorpha]AXC13024.1 Membrane protein, putative [Acidisarcina polymorpha]
MDTSVAVDTSPTLAHSGRNYRVQSLDVLRGLLMVIMALDHTRDYFSSAGIDPTDPIHSWTALFITRWITHICAPGFILLAGASVYLQRQRKSAAILTRTLILRGLWLIFFEITVISFGWSFGFGMPILQVIWVIGISMIALAALQWLPVSVIALFAIAVIFGHNLLDPVHASKLGDWSDVWRIFHERGLLTFHEHPIALYGYPVLPWVGVMALGYCFGAVVTLSPERRQHLAALIGALSLAGFALLRFTHSYGDPGPGFNHLGTPAQTVMSFFSVQKYPPSLHYLLVTLGIVLLLFSLFDTAVERGWAPRLRSFFNVYGRVPFFFYTLHIFLIHALALLVARATSPNWRFWITPDVVFTSHFAGWGYSLPVVYLIYIFVVFSLYPLCRWFSRLKDRRKDWWLAYL